MSTTGGTGAGRARWERETLASALARSPERGVPFETVSGRPVARLYDAADSAGLDYARDLGAPGSFPYTRGIHPTGYRGKLWTMRQFAGYGTPEQTNQRYKALLAAGVTGLSVAFDLPTLMGRDPDHPLSQGEVGKCGVSVASLADMEALFDGVNLADITTSMTINSPASMIFAMYLAVAERQGADWGRISGTLQNDIRGTKRSTSSPASTPHWTYSTASRSVKASSCTAVAPASRMWYPLTEIVFQRGTRSAQKANTSVTSRIDGRGG